MFVCLFVVLSLYLPMMIVVHGSVHPGHLAAGYLGLILVASATTAIGTFCSSITSHQLVAGILGAVLFLVYTQYMSLLPEFVLPEGKRVRSVWGYALVGELQEMERLSASLERAHYLGAVG